MPFPLTLQQWKLAKKNIFVFVIFAYFTTVETVVASKVIGAKIIRWHHLRSKKEMRRVIANVTLKIVPYANLFMIGSR